MGGVFCDWLSIYQVHAAEVPIVNAGRIFSVDPDGVIQWQVGTKLVHRGSHDTSVRISSDGKRVTLEGNIGRFNRQDNVFGYSIAECILLSNRLLESFGLPPFSDAAPMPLNGRAVDVAHDENGKLRLVVPNDLNLAGDSDKGYQAVGAVLTRVDLTCNWVTGSRESASQFIRHLQGFKSGKFEPRPYYTSGVSWGEGSKYWYAKVYDKAADYIRHRGVDAVDHNPMLYLWLKNSGIVRHEITLKSRYLKQNNLWRFAYWVDGMEAKIYSLFKDVVEGSVRLDEYMEIPGRAGELAVWWRDGGDLKKKLAPSTFRKYRKILKGYGIDIAVPPNIQRINMKVDVITVSPALPPAWYDLPRIA